MDAHSQLKITPPSLCLIFLDGYLIFFGFFLFLFFFLVFFASVHVLILCSVFSNL